jgi:hypothetical protein
LIPHKKKPNKELSPMKQTQNRELQEFRGDIERLFGRMVSKFNLFSNIYRFGDELFNVDLKSMKIINNLLKNFYQKYLNR